MTKSERLSEIHLEWWVARVEGALETVAEELERFSLEPRDRGEWAPFFGECWEGLRLLEILLSTRFRPGQDLEPDEADSLWETLLLDVHWIDGQATIARIVHRDEELASALSVLSDRVEDLSDQLLLAGRRLRQRDKRRRVAIAA